jgi:hypothetical protein
MELFGFFIGLGRLSSGKFNFKLDDETKISHLESLCKKIPLVELNRKGKSLQVVPNMKIIKLFKSYSIQKNNVIPTKLISNLSKKELISLLTGYAKAMGDSKTKEIPVNGVMLERLEHIAAMIGTEIVVSELSEDSFICKIAKKNNPYKFNGELSKTVNKVPYSGKINCIEVPNRILMVKRNHKMVWSGNSIIK